MALTVQANLALLRRLDARRRGLPIHQHEIQIPAPRRVERFRETLIDPIVAAAYSELELQLRLREIWGRYCALCWLFHSSGMLKKTDASRRDVAPPLVGGATGFQQINSGEGMVDFSTLAAYAPLECFTSVEIKLAEVHGFLWRFRYEQERRGTNSAGNTTSEERGVFARQIPARAFGKKVEDCTDEELLLASCEHAGMLAVLRWASHRRLAWDAPGIMEAGTNPFQ